jgi:type I restriction enzyme M protein
MEDTLRLAKINLAVHGLSGDIKEANSYYEDPHQATGKFDFVMANPPFNQNAVDKDRIKDDKKRYPFGMPSVDNANYLWIQLFYSALSPKGRAGFVMANSAADARGTELEMRKKLLATGAVDVIVSMSANLFYTVTLPATLWFLDRGKATSDRKDKVLFIDARHQFRPGGPRPPRDDPGAGRVPRQHRAPLPRGRAGEPPRQRQADQAAFPQGQVRRCRGTVQGPPR